ncbi:MAG: TerC/Alx family metal homeostasis membrane protein [Janthinobacterium lividum]
MTIHTEAWVLFLVGVAVLLILDLGIFRKREHQPSLKEAAIWSLVWISAALLFDSFIYFWQGHDAAVIFLTAYLLEKSLSLDNLFVFVMIFNFFAVSPKLQHRVLHWGIISAIVLRFLLITAGLHLVQKFDWILYIAGLFLVYSSVVLFRHQDNQTEPSGLKMLDFLKKKIPMLPDNPQGHFFRRQQKRWFVTPLFLVLVSIEFSDLVFALDSIPAVFAITLDPFMVFTSNIFAILGLRSLYFLLADLLPRFYYLKPALSIILGFVGIKMLIGHYVNISNVFSLGFIAVILSGALIMSWMRTKQLNKNI